MSRCFVFPLLLALAASALFAQNPTATMVGMVHDQTGAIVMSAPIWISATPIPTSRVKR